MNEPCASPCVNICELSPSKICTGCGRSLDEIAQWSQASEERRLQIVQESRKRLASITTPASTGHSA